MKNILLVILVIFILGLLFIVSCSDEPQITIYQLQSPEITANWFYCKNYQKLECGIRLTEWWEYQGVMNPNKHCHGELNLTKYNISEIQVTKSFLPD